MQWVRTGGLEDQASLDGWCAAVGGPVFTAATPVESGAVDALAVVSWNVHVGAGGVDRLVAELRAGDLTRGRPVDHFVLLLQEAVRVGQPVPGELRTGAVSAQAIGAPSDPSTSIEAVAERTGLFGFYAPSMRNGAEHREDRGNAILSTLPLEDPQAIELPYERQRRVAVSARVALPAGDGAATSLRVASVHLDNASQPSRFWRSFGAGRAHQVRALLDVFDGEEAIALGGDFNTWYGESEEEAIALLRPHFPWPPRLPAGPTYAPPYGLPERQVDYLLLRLPGGWVARYHVAPDKRDSDHAPLIGWLEVDARDLAASGGER